MNDLLNAADQGSLSPLETAVFRLLDAERIPASITYRILGLIGFALRRSRDRDHLLFEIPGTPISGNSRVTHYKNAKGSRLTSQARAYTARIKTIATAAAARTRWSIPEYAAIDLEIWNSNSDRDNIEKSVNDPLQGIVIANDLSILDGQTTRFWDAGEPRVIVTARKVNGHEYGFGGPRRRAARGIRTLPAHVRSAIELAQRR